MSELVDNLKTALDAGITLAKSFKPGSATDVVLVPEKCRIEAVEKIIAPYLDEPRRIKTEVRFDDLKSFILYVQEFKLPRTRIFGSAAPPSPKFTAIIDYHMAGGEATSSHPEPTPDWCDHRATYNPAFTVEWCRIVGRNTQVMTQTQLCLFVEENMGQIAEPKGADLLELCLTLEGRNDITCNQLIRLSNGKTKLTFSEEVTLKGVSGAKEGFLEFPTLLVFGIQAFIGGPTYAVKARMRYRIGSNRKLEFWFELVDVHLIVQNAVDAMVATINEKLEIDTLMGSVV